MKKQAVFTFMVLLAFVAVGCSSGGDSSPTASQEVLQGTYVLQQIRVTGNGADVTMRPPAVTGTVVVTPDGRFTATLNMPAGGTSGTWSGNYTVAGSTLTLNYDDGEVEVWTISPDRKIVSGTYTEDGMNITPTFAMA